MDEIKPDDPRNTEDRGDDILELTPDLDDEPPEENFILVGVRVGSPVAAKLDLIAKGSRVRRCRECGEPTWVQAIPIAHGGEAFLAVEVQCLDCLKAEMAEDDDEDENDEGPRP
jgi:hypothetical protein